MDSGSVVKLKEYSILCLEGDPQLDMYYVEKGDFIIVHSFEDWRQGFSNFIADGSN